MKKKQKPLSKDMKILYLTTHYLLIGLAVYFLLQPNLLEKVLDTMVCLYISYYFYKRVYPKKKIRKAKN